MSKSPHRTDLLGLVKLTLQILGVWMLQIFRKGGKHGMRLDRCMTFWIVLPSPFGTTLTMGDSGQLDRVINMALIPIARIVPPGII